MPVSDLAASYYDKYHIYLKTEEQIEGIKHACKVNAEILKTLCEHAKEGVTTLELDNLARELTKKASGTPAPLGYGDPPYPFAICTSLNEVVCHGMPSKEPLKNGDILNIDVSTIIDGYFGDSSAMVHIGEISEEKQRVSDTSYKALMESIKICKPGALIKDIGDVIEKVAAEANCSVVDEFVGHGVGIHFHEQPQIPHHKNNLRIPMAPGMTFTIEPMINAGSRRSQIDKADGWTARTIDGLPSAQWEHTLLITDTGHEILT